MRLSSTRVDKLWGHERILVNCPDANYCCKELYVEPYHACSYHFHPRKDETFLVTTGQLLLVIGPQIRDDRQWPDPAGGRAGLPEGEVYKLWPGDAVRLLPKTPHLFANVSSTPAVIVETSTYHDDEDVVRLRDSQRLSGEQISQMRRVNCA